MPSVFVLEAANLYAGDHDPAGSNHLVLQTLKLPGLEENFVDHNAGGAPVAIEVPTHINRLEAAFNLAGWQPWVMTLIGTDDAAKQTFTAYGAIRDQQDGSIQQAKAVMFGRLGRVNPTEFRKGDLQGHEYAIRGITRYSLVMGGQRIYDWNFFTSVRRVGEVDLNTALNRALAIPSGV